ncbi:MAG: MFS transporter [Pseudomonadota bacterium]|nr:MFS transporter [Pseudomonadota bacterium]
MNKNFITKKVVKGTFIWLLATAFYLYENLLQVSQSIIVPELMRLYDLNAHELSSTLGSVFLLAYGACQFPVGILLDKYSSKILLSSATLLCALSCFVYSQTSSINFAIMSRLFMGVGSAFAALGCLKLVSNWFEHRFFAFLTGATLSIGLLGSILGESHLLSLINVQGWREALKFIALLGFLLAIVLVFFIEDGNLPHSKNKTTSIPLIESLKELLAKSQVWIIAIYGMLMFTPFLVLSNLWGPMFISKIYNLEPAVATQVFEMIFAGFIFGAPFFGWLSDYILSRKKPLILASVAALIISTIILFIKANSLTYIKLLVFLFGFFTSGFLPAFSIIKEINPKQFSSTALGFMNTMNSLGGPVILSFMGLALDYLWDGKTVAGIRDYSIESFKIVFSIFPLLFLISCVLLMFISETNCKYLNESTGKTNE